VSSVGDRLISWSRFACSPSISSDRAAIVGTTVARRACCQPVSSVGPYGAGDDLRARDLKAEDGLDIWVVGGGKLAHALLPEIDRLILKQHASVIGSGIPMFDGRSRRISSAQPSSGNSTPACGY
jgi:riboflavin biosynthesis pyrimidine reductase